MNRIQNPKGCIFAKMSSNLKNGFKSGRLGAKMNDCLSECSVFLYENFFIVCGRFIPQKCSYRLLC